MVEYRMMRFDIIIQMNYYGTIEINLNKWKISYRYDEIVL